MKGAWSAFICCVIPAHIRASCSTWGEEFGPLRLCNCETEKNIYLHTRRRVTDSLNCILNKTQPWMMSKLKLSITWQHRDCCNRDGSVWIAYSQDGAPLHTSVVTSRDPQTKSATYLIDWSSLHCKLYLGCMNTLGIGRVHHISNPYFHEHFLFCNGS